MPADSERNRLLSQLRAEIQLARDRFEAAKLEFDQATAKAHRIGVAAPEGSALLQSASTQYNQSARAYGDVLKRFAEVIHDMSLIDPPQ